MDDFLFRIHNYWILFGWTLTGTRDTDPKTNPNLESHTNNHQCQSHLRLLFPQLFFLVSHPFIEISTTEVPSEILALLRINHVLLSNVVWLFTILVRSSFEIIHKKSSFGWNNQRAIYESILAAAVSPGLPVALESSPVPVWVPLSFFRPPHGLLLQCFLESWFRTENFTLQLFFYQKTSRSYYIQFASFAIRKVRNLQTMSRCNISKFESIVVEVFHPHRREESLSWWRLMLSGLRLEITWGKWGGGGVQHATN